MRATDRFARRDLLFGPSPVHRLDRLTEELGGATIWAKRDDVSSGLAFGGNKTRKLEFLVADALAQGCDTLVSIGGVQSNHTRQVAAVSAFLGLDCVLVQESWVDWPDAVYDRVGNIQLSRILGADVRLVDAGFGIGFKESWERALAEVEERGGKPYAIPAGASDHPLGGLGYARWAEEVAQQEQELGVFFDTVIVCSVTGSTQAGMIAGFAGQERARRVLGIDGSAKPRETREQVARIARATAELIGLGRELRDDEIELDDRWHGGVYGIPDGKTLDAIRTAARLEGMITDPVYEGKSMAALIDLVRDGEIARDSNVLYAHLGGQTALSGYSALFRSEQPARAPKRRGRSEREEFAATYHGHDRERLVRDGLLLDGAPAKGTALIEDEQRTAAGTALLAATKDVLSALLFGEEHGRTQRELLTVIVPKAKAHVLDFLQATTEIGAVGTWDDPKDQASDVDADNVVIQVEYGEVEGEKVGDAIVVALNLINELEVNEEVLYARMENVEQSTLPS